MYSIEKEFKAEYSHRLMYHNSKCFHLHGHSAKILVRIWCESLNENGMIIDFGHLNQIREYIDNNFDHMLILNKDDLDVINPLVSTNLDFRIRLTHDEPTAEYFSKEIAEIVLRTYRSQIDITKVEVTFYETAKNSATFSIENNG